MASTIIPSQDVTYDLLYHQGWRFAESQLATEPRKVLRAAIREFRKNSPAGMSDAARIADGAIAYCQHRLEEES